MDLFNQTEIQSSASLPLSESLRPKSLAEFVGQGKTIGEKLPLIKNLREKNFLPNLLLWGPPGTGKTTFARLLGGELKAQFVSCNAIDTGAKDLREMGVRAHDRRLISQEKTLLFIDEIHRLNKSQQDVLLPFTEKGDLILVGATTENPSYEMNSALLSRMRVLIFEPHSTGDLRLILNRAFQAREVEPSRALTPEAIDTLISHSSGDARRLLNSVEVVLQNFLVSEFSSPMDPEALVQLLGDSRLRYDKNGDEHYDIISAFIKSVRGSDPDAAVYYLARMLESGEDPLFIARRLVILASEDIGNADPRALSLAVSGLQAVELIGLPEARISLSQVTTYLASAPKSNRAYLAINEAQECVRRTGALPVPLSLRSAQTAFAKKIGYGEGYKYSHDFPRGFAEQQFLPDQIEKTTFYSPSEHGFEKNIRAHLDWLKNRNPKNQPE